MKTFASMILHKLFILLWLPKIANWRVRKVFINQGSLIDILYWSIFLKLYIPIYHQIIPRFTTRIHRKKVLTRSYVDMVTTFGMSEAHWMLKVHYILVEVDTLFNFLIGWRTLNQLEAIVSTTHIMLKFLLKIELSLQ